jgi:ribosomal protein S18 acetylase RimI-like enzyme
LRFSNHTSLFKQYLNPTPRYGECQNSTIEDHPITVKTGKIEIVTNMSNTINSPIRRLDVHRDLSEAADLIEMCFGSQMDPDGHTYLRNIRRAAHNNDHLRWLPGPGEQATYPLFGYVWEEDHKIIGNISLIPVLHKGSWRYLIANVAVHPDYRGRGIGHELTLRALQHIQTRNVPLACLQVRDITPIAYNLYRSHGFIERARRTTWVLEPARGSILPPNPDVQIQNRPSADWSIQSGWLKEIYPSEVQWNLLYNQRRLSPNLFQRFLNFANGKQVRHWTAYYKGQLTAALFWEPTYLYADNLWLATDLSNIDDEAIYSLLVTASKALNKSRPQVINFPDGVAVEAFKSAGCSLQNTLIWMEKRL